MDTVTFAPGAVPQSLAEEMHVARTSQFVDRLQWDLTVTEAGEEFDQFDDENAHYIVVKSLGRHVQSCRIRPVCSGTMIEQCFSGIFTMAEDFLSTNRKSLWEVTRFCKSPAVTLKESAAALRIMSFELDEFMDRVGAAGFISVVYPHFPRFLQRLGVRYLCLASGKINEEDVQLICVTRSVDFRDNETRGRRAFHDVIGERFHQKAVA